MTEKYGPHGNDDWGQLGNNNFYETWLVTRAGENELISKDINVDMMIGEDYQIDVSLGGDFNAYLYEETLGNLKYETNTPNIIEVSNTGKITAKAQGYGIVKVTETDKNLETYIKVTVVPYKGDAVPDIQSGLDFGVALKADGSVWAWGSGAAGRLGNGNTANQTEPVRVLMPDGKTPITNARKIEVRI